MKKEFNVIGMSCAACASRIEKDTSQLDGIQTVSVNLLTNSMSVEFDGNKVTTKTIIKCVEDAGYGATEKNAESNNKEKNNNIKSDDELKNMKKRLIISFVFLIPLMYISMGHMLYTSENVSWFYSHFMGIQNAINFVFTQFLLLLPILYVNRKYFANGFKALFKKSPNMDSLIAISSTASTIYGIYAIYKIGYGLGHENTDIVHSFMYNVYFESAGTILTLITLGKYFETKAKNKTSDAISKLINLAPKFVTVIRNGKEEKVKVEDITKGELFVIHPGESVAVDGVIEEGKSSFDESTITGESIPVEKKEGDTIISASINKSGLIRAKATRVGEDTTIAQIIKFVEEASASKAPIAKLADKVAGIFVPVVIVISILTLLIWLIVGATFEEAMSFAISVLVISCPCALGLATPVAIMVGTGKGAENQILIKSGDAIETMHHIDTVVLDKTGTITKGKPEVVEIKLYDNRISKNELLRIAGSLEKGSEHVLAEAIIKKCEEEKIMIDDVTEFQAVFGEGICGTINGKKYFGGNEKLIVDNNILLNEDIKKDILKLSKQGITPLIFANEEKAVGIIGVADTIKDNSILAVKYLKKMGIRVIMLTGDNKIVAESIKEKVGIDEVIAELYPEEKAKKIAELKDSGKKVSMVGDGINDAPALISADVGVAIGTGTDIAIESADIILMKSDLLDVISAIKLSRAVMRNIKENLFWAFVYNIVGIPVAAGILFHIFEIKLNPMIAAVAMSLSSVCVVTNALRLKRLDLSVVTTNQKTRKEEFNVLNKVIKIEGMACEHCTSRVQDSLLKIDGVQEVEMSLESKCAKIKADESVSNDILKKAIEEAGYKVIEINNF